MYKKRKSQALQELVDTLCSTAQTKQYTCCAFTGNALHKCDRHWTAHAIITPVVLYLIYIIGRGSGFATMTKAVALSVDKLCDFVSQIVSKIKCVLLFYLFIFYHP